jgi:hypothetical protein
MGRRRPTDHDQEDIEHKEGDRDVVKQCCVMPGTAFTNHSRRAWIEQGYRESAFGDRRN